MSTILAIYGGLHLTIGLIVLLLKLCEEYPYIRKGRERASFLPVLRNVIIIVTCWPLVVDEWLQ